MEVPIRLAWSSCALIGAVVLNTAYITVVALVPQMQSQSNLLNVGLSASSIELAIGAIVKLLLERSQGIFRREHIFEAAQLFWFKGIFWQCMTLTGCALERWISIIKPLHYETYVTNKRVTLFVVTGYLVSAFVAFPFFSFNVDIGDIVRDHVAQNKSVDSLNFSDTFTVGVKVYIWTWATAVLIMIIIALCMYIIIFRVLKKQINKIQPEGTNPSTVHKGVVKLLFIMVYFTITWGLQIIYLVSMVTFAIPLTFPRSQTSTILQNCMVASSMGSTIISPLIYGLTTKQFKQAAKRLLCKTKEEYTL